MLDSLPQVFNSIARIRLSNVGEGMALSVVQVLERMPRDMFQPSLVVIKRLTNHAVLHELQCSLTGIRGGCYLGVEILKLNLRVIYTRYVGNIDRKAFSATATRVLCIRLVRCGIGMLGSSLMLAKRAWIAVT